MSRSVVLAVVVSVLFSVCGLSEWVAPIETQKTVSRVERISTLQTNEVVIVPSFVRLDGISIRIMPENMTRVFVRWSWLDSASNVVDRGVRDFTQEQIDDKLKAMGSSFAEMQSLFMIITADDAVTPDE